LEIDIDKVLNDAVVIGLGINAAVVTAVFAIGSFFFGDFTRPIRYIGTKIFNALNAKKSTLPVFEASTSDFDIETVINV